MGFNWVLGEDQGGSDFVFCFFFFCGLWFSCLFINVLLFCLHYTHIYSFMYLHLEIQEFKIEYKLLLLCIIFCNEKNDNKAQHIFLEWRVEKSLPVSRLKLPRE